MSLTFLPFFERSFCFRIFHAACAWVPNHLSQTGVDAKTFVTSHLVDERNILSKQVKKRLIRQIKWNTEHKGKLNIPKPLPILEEHLMPGEKGRVLNSDNKVVFQGEYKHSAITLPLLSIEPLSNAAQMS